MSVKSVKFETSYDVGAGDVRLTVVVGNMQFGTSAVSLNGVPLAVGDVNGLRIPADGGLAGRDLFVKSIVTDINDMSDRTSLRYVLTGGVADKQFDLEAAADQEGDSVVYRTTIHFV